MSKAKRRSDTKHEIKATLPSQLREQLEKRADETGISAFALAAELTEQALEDDRVIMSIAPWFQSGYPIDGSRIIMGHLDPGNLPVRQFLEPLLPDGDDVSRFPVKLERPVFVRVAELAHALLSSKTVAITILLSEALRQDIPLKQEEIVNG